MCRANHACIECPLNTLNDAGDDASGFNTTCRTPVSAEEETPFDVASDSGMLFLALIAAVLLLLCLCIGCFQFRRSSRPKYKHDEKAIGIDTESAMGGDSPLPRHSLDRFEISQTNSLASFSV